jgi:DNA-binding SARP family transcriptional activator/tetratricopeptide (TPR) repeat protein
VTVRLLLLGGFQAVVDGAAVPRSAWARRHAAALVKVLVLADGRRLHREQVLDLIWPGVDQSAAAPRLHKAAHYARRALGDRALGTGNEMLWLDGGIEVDAAEFHALGERAVRDKSVEAAADALALYGGPLLPDDIFEPWTERPREEARFLYLELLRLTGRWEAVLREEPSDEQAHLALIHARADQRDFRGALRQFQRMEQALHRELGVVPSDEAQRLRTQIETAVRGITSSAPPPRRPLIGRREVSYLIREHLGRAAQGRGGTLMVSGRSGVGKTALLEQAIELAEHRGFRTGRGTASAVEDPWPYAAVLEGFSDLCRKHPALLDGLDEALRAELERALSGRDMAWTGESSHQRLFVAAAELLRLAAAGRGLLLAVDDIHESDDASLRLLHYLSRCAVSEPVLIVAAHRPTNDRAFTEISESLVTRGAGTGVPLRPLTEQETMQLLADRFPDLSTATARQIWTVSGGIPFAIVEAARDHTARGSAALSALPASARATLQRVALLGATFTADELLACADVGENEAYHHLEQAIEARFVEPDGPGYRFRHPLVREALLEALPPHQEPAARRAAAEALVQTNAPPGRVAWQFLKAGLPSRAVPYALPAVETAGALGAYRDALALLDAVRPHADPADLPTLLARRGDLLLALGDPDAVAAYQQALAVTTGTENRMVRARLARAATFTGDLQTARAAIAGLSLEGDAADSSILRAEGAIAYFSGDIDRAWEIAGRARELLHSPDDPWHLVDLVNLQGLIAHQRGEWFERFRLELRRTQGKQRLAAVLFDAHLCVAEYVLYGPVPYAEVIQQAEELRRSAADAGALRGVAFATALAGEAALLMDDLERAEPDLLEAVDLHREVDAAAGEAHCLQRLAEVHLARGDREGARQLLQKGLPLARWSLISMHLMQRIYGTMIEAAEDAAEARAVVDMAEATIGETDRCPFCAVMLAVPAAIACANVGDLEAARRYLAIAEESAARWEGTAWSAAVEEARGHLAAAEARPAESADLFDRAADLFAMAGHRRAADRCRAAAVAAGALATSGLPH